LAEESGEGEQEGALAIVLWGQACTGLTGETGMGGEVPVLTLCCLLVELQCRSSGRKQNGGLGTAW